MDKPNKMIKSMSAHFDMLRDLIADYNYGEEIVLRDPEELRKKILSMREDGKSKLNILADFDGTLTKKTYQGKPAHNSFNAIENVILKLI